MSIKNYWPSPANIAECIHSEAEELSNALLLAVHNPMTLVSSTFSNTQPELKQENDLLEHLLQTNRPIPIVGESGGGKSHLIRWLHAQLENHPQVKAENWHIIRIPKNASMRQVLSLMLKDLSGDVFDAARKKVNEVGAKLSSDLMRSIFFNFICEALRYLSEDSRRAAKVANDAQDRVGYKQWRERSVIAQGLSVCLADPVFQNAFSDQGKPISNTIDRLIHSKSYAEVEQADYSVRSSDLDFLSARDFEFSEFNAQAKKTIEKLQLTSSEQKVEQAVEVINQAVSDATKLIFNHFFQFTNGSFQDLFVDIRRALKQQDRTLVILVEDLAAISAIDDVLIDSLLQEDKYDGVQALCPLKSVIATTTNQDTYKMRRETILTRSGYEWRIPSDEDLLKVDAGIQPDIEKVIDFCARYLNAARHGIGEIDAHFANGDMPDPLPVWTHKGEMSEEEHIALEDFGFSSDKIALFPFSDTAIRKLAKSKLYRHGRKKFNPRAVIKEVLIPILRDNYGDFELGQYPSANFYQQHLSLVSDALREWSRHQITDVAVRERVNGFVSVYGAGRTETELLSSVTNRQAEVFNLPPEFGEQKQEVDTKDDDVDVTPAKPAPGKFCSDCGEVLIQCRCDKPTPPVVDPCLHLEEEVNAWFSGQKRLSAKDANTLRKHLFYMLVNNPGLSRFGVESAQKWKPWTKLTAGDKSLFDVVLKSGPRYRIDVPNAMGESEGIIQFCREEEINNSDASFVLKRQALAILRYDYYKSKNLGWDYQQAFDDYVYYMEFVARWVPKATQKCVAYIREDLPKIMAKQWALAQGLGLKPTRKPVECMNLFVKRAAHIRDLIASPINGEFAQLQEELLLSWEEVRQELLKRLGYKKTTGSPVAIDAFEFQIAFKAMDEHRGEVLSKAQRQLLRAAIVQVKPKLTLINEQTMECEKSEELRELLEELREAYKGLPSEVISKDGVSMATRRDRVKKLQKRYEWALIAYARKFVQASDELEVIEVLYQIDGDAVDLWYQVLTEWREVCSYSLPRLEKINQARGSEQLHVLTQNIDTYLNEISQSLSAMSTYYGQEERDSETDVVSEESL